MTLHQDKIKNPFKVQKLSLIQRSITGEKRGGKKEPRLLDLDAPADGNQTKQNSKTCSRLPKKAKTSTQNSTEPQFVFEDSVGENIEIEQVPLLLPVGDCDTNAVQTFVLQNDDSVLSANAQFLSDVTTSPDETLCYEYYVAPDYTDELKESFNLLRTPEKKSCSQVAEEIDYVEKYRIDESLFDESVFDKPKFPTSDWNVVKLEHNYFAKEEFLYDDDLKTMVPKVLFRNNGRPDSGVRCSSDLVQFVKIDNWLKCSIINECILSEMTVRNGLDRYCFVDSCYYNDVACSHVSDGLFMNLQQSKASSKRGLFVVMNTDLQRGKHWMLGCISLDKKVICICESMIHKQRDYSTLFLNLFKIAQIALLTNQRSTKFDEWKFHLFNDIAQQPNSWDCGVFVYFYMKQILLKQSLQICNCVSERENVKVVLATPYKTKKLSRLQKKLGFTQRQYNEIRSNNQLVPFVFGKGCDQVLHKT